MILSDNFYDFVMTKMVFYDWTWISGIDFSGCLQYSNCLFLAFSQVLAVLEDKELHSLHSEKDEISTHMCNARPEVYAYYTVPGWTVSFVKSLSHSKQVGIY